MQETRRTRQVSNLIKVKLSDIIIRTIMGQGMGMITITDVNISRDLKIANVYFSIMGGQKDIQKQINILKNMAKFFRYRLSGKIILKYMPKIEMIYDETSLKAQKIDAIFNKIKRENR